MKKLIIIVGITLLLTGCVENVSLTEQENDMIADYTSDLLLKYDKNYNQSFLVLKEEPEEIETEVIQETGENQGLADKKTINKEVVGEAVDGEYVSLGLNTEIKLPLDALPEILGIQNLSIAYSGFEICDFFPNNIEQGKIDAVFDSGSDYELIVIKLLIQNTSDESKLLDILGSNSSFLIKINNQIEINADRTILLNDFTTFFQTIEPDQLMEVFLIGKISNDFVGEVSTVDLGIIRKGSSSIISLQ